MEQKLRTYFSQLSHLADKEKIADALRVLIQDELAQRSPVPHGNDLDHLERALKNFYEIREFNYIITLLENYTKTGSFKSGEQNLSGKALSERYLKIYNLLNELFETDKKSIHEKQVIDGTNKEVLSS